MIFGGRFMESSIYLMVLINFPRPFNVEYEQKAEALQHAAVGKDCIDKFFAASGGVGAGSPCLAFN